MAKSHLRLSAASGSDRRKVELLIRRGWKPGRTFGECLARIPSKSKPDRLGQEVTNER
jgi:hypothetical protein